MLARQFDHRVGSGCLAQGRGGGDAGLRSMTGDFLKRGRGPHQKIAAVPKASLVDELARPVRVGLLDEFGDVRNILAFGQRGARADVAIAGLRFRRRDAEDDDPPRLGRRPGHRHGAAEPFVVADRVVGGKNENQGVRILIHGPSGGGGNRGGRAHCFGFEQQRAGDACLAKACLDQVAMLGTGDDQRLREDGRVGDTRQRRRKSRLRAPQRQERFRHADIRGRPQPGAGTAGKEHWQNGLAHEWTSSGLPGSCRDKRKGDVYQEGVGKPMKGR